MKFSVAQTQPGGGVTAATGVTYNGMTAFFDTLVGSVNRPVLKIAKTVEVSVSRVYSC